jgi:hypothetical protein
MSSIDVLFFSARTLLMEALSGKAGGVTCHRPLFASFAEENLHLQVTECVKNVSANE